MFYHIRLCNMIFFCTIMVKISVEFSLSVFTEMIKIYRVQPLHKLKQNRVASSYYPTKSNIKKILRNFKEKNLYHFIQGRNEKMLF